MLVLPTPFSQNYCCTYFTTIVKHLYIAWLSLYLVISMNYSRQKLAKIPCNDIAIVPELFCLSSIPTQSGEPLCYDQGRLDRKRVAYRAVSNLVSITFCERST